MTLKRGQKTCPKCKEVNASRQRKCKFCSTIFVAKEIIGKDEVTDWKNLLEGEYIKVIQGTGPYFISVKDSDESQEGERIYMGVTGVYKVAGIDEKGIRVYGTTIKNGGLAFIYMGPKGHSDITGTYLQPYRIKRVKVREHAKCNSKRNNRK